ncbi:hypothetical protein D3C81_1281800 [compost metagenome]|uniref:hypothetical protein n=1 Tax=Pseudomonas putida TaxID=303 RepID=UPI0005BB2C69|nr:hypothetical protein [Pseudomonas putida]
MTDTNVWLEANKSNGALLSYFLDRPTTQSAAVDYIEATQDELLYLNTLEDYILPAGTVVTLSDLQEHRERLQEAKIAKAAQHIRAAQKPPQKPSQDATVASNKHSPTNTTKFKAGFKPVRQPRK